MVLEEAESNRSAMRNVPHRGTLATVREQREKLLDTQEAALRVGGRTSHKSTLKTPRSIGVSKLRAEITTLKQKAKLLVRVFQLAGLDT